MRSGYMVEPESVLPTPAPVTIQTALMTSRRSCRPRRSSSGARMRRRAWPRCHLGVAVGGAVGVPVGEAVGVPVGVGRRWRCWRRRDTRASAIHVKHDVHVGESNVPGRRRVRYTAIDRAEIAQRWFLAIVFEPIKKVLFSASPFGIILPSPTPASEPGNGCRNGTLKYGESD